MLSSRPARRLMAALAATLSLAAVGTVPALAADPATVAVHVVDSVSHQPLANISVYAESDSGEKFAAFGATDANGEIAVPAGGDNGSDPLTAGRWEFLFTDDGSARVQSGTTYVDARGDVTIHSGVNDLGEQGVDPGGVVSGTARTPSGHLLVNLGYFVEARDDGPSGLGYAINDYAEPGDATFSTGGLPTGTYDLSYDQSPRGDLGDYRLATSFEITQPGQQVTTDLSVRVAATPEATTLVGSSPSTGTVQLVFKIANTHYRITDPHGVVTVTSAQGKTIGDPVPVTEVNGHGKAVLTFPASSTSHTYRAYYSSGPDNTADLRSISRTVKVSVQ